MAEPPVTVRAIHDSGLGNITPTRVVIHATCPSIGYPDASVAGQALGTARYFQEPTSGGSAHYVCDAAGEQHCVPDSVIAWHAPPNPNSIGIEVCGEGGDYPLSYTREQWLSPQVLPAVRRAAQRAAELCARFGIPTVKISTADLLNGAHGICGHVDVSQAWHESDHSDPGPGFPWPEFMAYVNTTAHRKDHTVMDQLPATPTPADPKSDPKTWPQRNYDVGFDLAGGWEGDVAIEFGAQDWGGRTGDDVRGFLYLASWHTPAGLVPADPVYTVAGGGRPIHAHTPTVALVAPKGATALTLNYAAPGGAYVAEGRSA